MKEKKYKEVTMEEAIKMLCLSEGRKKVFIITELEPFDYIRVLGDAVKFLMEDEG